MNFYNFRVEIFSLYDVPTHLVLMLVIECVHVA